MGVGAVGAGVCGNVFADGEGDEVSGVTRWACNLRNGLSVCAALYQSARAQWVDGDAAPRRGGPDGSTDLSRGDDR